MLITENKLQLAKLISAERPEVFAAWADRDLVKEWFCPEDMKVVMYEWNFQVDRNYRISMVDKDDEHFTTHGTFKEIIPNEKIVMTFGWEGPDRVETLLTIDLIDKGSNTEVILTHEKFIDLDQVKKHAEGWASTLEHLAKQFGLEEVG